jgi:hypothetical protein
LKGGNCRAQQNLWSLRRELSRNWRGEDKIIQQELRRKRRESSAEPGGELDRSLKRLKW